MVDVDLITRLVTEVRELGKSERESVPVAVRPVVEEITAITGWDHCPTPAVRRLPRYPAPHAAPLRGPSAQPHPESGAASAM